ncbi:MAG TPA: tRNA dimethylallyltransferase, partial [Longimicrobiales bacterium]
RLDPLRREALKQFLEPFSRQELLRWLGCLDEASAARLSSAGGRQRLARAIEIALLSGRSLSEWHREQTPQDPVAALVFSVSLPRDVLYDRINQRVDEMLAAGLVGEVRTLIDAGFDERAPGMSATGYSEVVSYLKGEITLAAAAERIRAATRQYARRQLTWFRHQLPADTIILDGLRPQSDLVDEIVHAWQAA